MQQTSGGEDVSMVISSEKSDVETELLIGLPMSLNWFPQINQCLILIMSWSWLKTMPHFGYVVKLTESYS